MSAKLNLEFYSGTDHYSDGDIEDELLEIIKSGQDIEKVLVNDNRWPILYHLSPIRQNIINWYPFKANTTCLEIGGGCGAITGALCDGLYKVKVVELSKRRSTINYERNKHRDNLEIFVGNLNDIKFDDKFDYITLNGVLEYAGSFTNTDEPYKDFLKNVKKFLKPNGKLIVAIENRYGLKYFAGAKEDHTAKEFDSITGYTGNKNVRTFGKKELEVLLNESGYPVQEFYYPHPDYKMPMEIYSQHWLPTTQSLLSKAPNFDNERYELFNESEGFRGIIENGQYEFFANSFLVVCGE
ncbi:Glycosyl transferase, group 2 family protein [hydrothermal vent metagenome]|uniref:Glycosyl transferase, group 2 family protein n=1 Tax=hydrothermal vent metagenome TaxID=652676 RepID=A0A3B1DTQ6_9ZZZZ